MDTDVARDMRRSKRAFRQFVQPVLVGVLGKGEIVAVETIEDETVRHKLDNAGFDYLYEQEPGLLRGIASRVQFVDEPFDTFTVRYSRATGTRTEWAKRLEAILDVNGRGWLYPAITCQAYVTCDESRLLALYVVKTRPLFEYIEQDFALPDDERKICTRTNRNDASTFLCPSVGGLRAAGFDVWTWPDTSLTEG